MRILAPVAALVVALAATASFACSCTLTGEKDGLPTFDKACPKQISSFAKRAVQCQHFAGEITGDASERDKEVNKKLTALKCDTLSKDYEHIREHYAEHHAQTLGTLNEVLKKYAVELQ